MKRNVICVILLFFAIFFTVFVSCKDDSETEDPRENGGVLDDGSESQDSVLNKEKIRIENIVLFDDTDSILTVLMSKQKIVVNGKNLRKVEKVFLIEKNGEEEKLLFDSTFVAENFMILDLPEMDENVVGLRFSSKKDSVSVIYNITSVAFADPMIKGFYCEFVPNGGSLHIKGDNFMGEPNKTLKVYFYDKYRDTTVGKITRNTMTDIYVRVPVDAADGTFVTVQTSKASVTSKVKLRDRSQVFLDFDDLDIPAGGWTGALDPTTGEYNAGVSGYALPEGCDGKFGALVQGHSWSWKTTNTMAYEQSARSKDGKEGHDQWNKTKCLLDLNTKWNGNNIDYKYDSNDYLLKFEVYVPEDMPLKNWFDLAFYQYGSEDNSEGDFYNGGGFAPWDYMKLGDASALPAARLVLGDFDVKFKDNDAVYSYPTGIPGHEKGFYTSGWRTVAIPLTSEYFQFAPSDKSIGTSIKEGKSSGVLAAKEFFNMWISPEPNGMPQNEFFIAFDNFRIVKDDGNGLIPGVWGTGTTNGVESCVRDYFE